MTERPGKELEVIKVGIRTVDSKVELIKQKIQMIEKNEEVLGRTLIQLNEKIKAIQANSGNKNDTSNTDVAELQKQINELNQKMREIKALLDMINPLEYARLDQIKELIKEEIEKRMKEKELRFK